MCRSRDLVSPLALTAVAKETAEHVIEGLLTCGHPACQREYPIIDGIPIILAALRDYLKTHVFEVCHRRDFSPVIESVLNDCCGPGSSFDVVRQHTSSYTWDHFGDLDPSETETDPAPGGVARLLDVCLQLAGDTVPGPVLDIGCGVGRTTFELAAATEQCTLGIDMNFPMLRIAAETLREGRVRYPRRRIGLVYDNREFDVHLPAAGAVDFWVCDALSPPFPSHRFGLLAALNAIDCVASPVDLLHAFASLLDHRGKAVLATPYDWSAAATAVEAWLGGHSQRGQDGGAAEPVLRRLLTPDDPYAVPGLRLIGETESDWHVRMHQRSVVKYRVHCAAIEQFLPDAQHESLGMMGGSQESAALDHRND